MYVLTSICQIPKLTPKCLWEEETSVPLFRGRVFSLENEPMHGPPSVSDRTELSLSSTVEASAGPGLL
jgi:hypothetical protein